MSSESQTPEPTQSVFMDSPLFCNLDAHRVTLQAIIDHSPAEISLKDLDGKFILVNRKFGERVGEDSTEVVGKSVEDYFELSDADGLLANDCEVLAGGKAKQFEETLSRDDETWTQISQKFPLLDEAGEVYAVCSISTDITERKADEKNLRQLNSRIQQQGRTLEAVLSASPNIVYMFDSRGRFLYANQAGAANFGVRPVEIIGKTWDSLNLPDGIFDPFMTQVSKVFRIGSTIKDSLAFHTSEGGQEFAYTLIPIMDIRGRVVNVIAYVNDVTRDREKDRILEVQARELNRSNLELEEFARIASQDLNDPLHKVQRHLDSLESILGEGISEEVKVHLSGAFVGAGRMKVLVSDLLEYSRVGLRNEPFEKVDMGELVAVVREDISSVLLSKNASVRVSRLPTVWGNENRLKQLITNLVSNGLQFNEHGSPVVEISVEQRNEFWVFEVKDNGIGIESKDFESVFQIFQRLNRRTETSGTGVGLAICRKIVSQHGGEIWVRSMPGAGSSFFFTLPIRQVGGHQMTIDLFE